jgi:hypothetical protein
MRILENGIYRDMTPEEIANIPAVPAEYKIEELKHRLEETDYKAIKYAEGLISEEEYADTKALRQSWRDEINELEKEAR